jgi:hypothetical protein
MLDSYSRFCITPAFNEMIRAYHASKNPAQSRSALNIMTGLSRTKSLKKIASVPSMKIDEFYQEVERRLAFNG